MGKTKVTIVTGFLEAGKTTYINSCFFNNLTFSSKPLVISMEQGEKDYPKIGNPCDIAYLDNVEQFTPDSLNHLLSSYPAKEVFIEVNGFISTRQIIDNIPLNWYIVDVVALFDSTTFISLFNNYTNIISEKIRNASCIIFNRCTPQLAENIKGKNISSINPIHNIFFQMKDGLMPYHEEELNFSYDHDNRICIENNQYLSWYTDSIVHPEKYIGRTIHISGFLRDSSSLPDNNFIIERDYIYCCKDDMLLLNIYCCGSTNLPADCWVTIEGIVQKNENCLIDKPYCVQITSIVKSKEIMDSVIF